MAQTKFGLNQITNSTPLWASWLFRIVFILTTAATFVIASDPTINDSLKVQIGVYMKGLDMLIYGFSKMFGVKVTEDTTDEPKP